MLKIKAVVDQCDQKTSPAKDVKSQHDFELAVGTCIMIKVEWGLCKGGHFLLRTILLQTLAPLLPYLCDCPIKICWKGRAGVTFVLAVYS